ncbi:unnamed protein product, partial [Polarella glacialis]
VFGLAAVEMSEDQLGALQAAIASGDIQAASSLARALALSKTIVTAEIDHGAAAASVRRQFQVQLIAKGYPPAKVAQALRRGDDQTLAEACAWLDTVSTACPGRHLGRQTL